MKGVRWSPDRLRSCSTRPLCLSSRVTPTDRGGSLFAVCSSLLWPGGSSFRPTIGFGAGPLSIDFDADDSNRITALRFGHTGGPGVAVRVCGWADDGSEDAARSYSATVQSGGTTVNPGTDAATSVRLRVGAKGQWTGFNTYTD